MVCQLRSTEEAHDHSRIELAAFSGLPHERANQVSGRFKRARGLSPPQAQGRRPVEVRVAATNHFMPFVLAEDAFFQDLAYNMISFRIGCVCWFCKRVCTQSAISFGRPALDDSDIARASTRISLA